MHLFRLAMESRNKFKVAGKREMATSNYSILEEEIISTHFQRILHTLKVYHLVSDRIGLEMALQNGKICGSNLNFYKTRPDALGNINCVVHSLSEPEKERVRTHVMEILQALSVAIPADMFGHVELVAEYDPAYRMRIKNLLLNLRSTFKLSSVA